MFRLIVIFVTMGFYFPQSFAINLNKGHGALLYDTNYSGGAPSSTPTNSPGQWISNINAFNVGAQALSKINRLYPYSGNISMTCTVVADCIYSGSGQNVFVGYSNNNFGPASVAAYRSAFPQALILAIIDADTTTLPLLSSNAVGVGIANELTEQMCSDPNVDGVFFDLEPFNFDQNQGQFALFKQISVNFASSQCIDGQHPKGRIFAIFMNPNKVNDWSVVPGMLGQNGYLVVAAYDINDTTPPRPTPYQLYTSSVTGKIQGFMDPSSQKYQIPYAVAVPAASSFSEFEQFGYYNASYPNDFQLQTDYTTQGFTQLTYIQTVRGILLKNATSAYYLGMDYWSWGQYKSPVPKQGQLLMPNLPPANVVQYLQQYGG
jgi:hypothetical protein